MLQGRVKTPVNDAPGINSINSQGACVRALRYKTKSFCLREGVES